MKTKKREIIVEGFKVELHNFGKLSFLYPSFNGNAEFEVNQDGFKKLRHYLKNGTMGEKTHFSIVEHVFNKTQDNRGSK